MAQVFTRLRAWLGGRSTELDDHGYVDVDDLHRQREIREAEHQRSIDRQARVLRVSGKVPQGPYRRRAAMVERRRG